LDESFMSALQLDPLSPLAAMTKTPPSFDESPFSGSSIGAGHRPPSSTGRKIHGCKTYFSKQWRKWQRKIPFLKKIQETILRAPPQLRMAFVVFWVGWKVVLILIFVFMTIQQSQTQPQQQQHPSFLTTDSWPNMTFRHPHLQNNMNENTTKVLYIVTSLAEFNTGRRKTVKGSDRFLHQLLPVLVDSVESMVMESSLQVDVFLICAYPLQQDRETMIRYRLPQGVGFQFWDNAMPLSYPPQNKTGGRLLSNSRALARQHRYVVKDKLEYYDMLVAFEDDMLIRGSQVQQYWQLSLEIEQLRVMAPKTIYTADNEMGDNVDDYRKTKFFGIMSKSQLERVVPGFVRVEVIVNDTDRTAKNQIKFPADWDFGDEFGGTRHIDPSICCHFHMEPLPLPDERFPETPDVDDIIIWETNIKAFSLRQFPTSSSSSRLDWAALMMGPGKKLRSQDKIGGYWSGREGAFGDEKRPSGGEPRLVAQQGGWMATKEQVIRMHNRLCLAEFLPPFDRIAGGSDGLHPQNVEFWSGSYQFFTGAGNHCNMQRIISMRPDHFSKHLLYHTANNKQKQLTQRRMLRANQLFGQLNRVKKMAEIAKSKILAKQ
jgi:hypothetical protein